jgi:hypothetical protein
LAKWNVIATCGSTGTRFPFFVAAKLCASPSAPLGSLFRLALPVVLEENTSASIADACVHLLWDRTQFHVIECNIRRSWRFVYTPGEDVVGVGLSQTLSATFTPTDANQYDCASASVQIAVNKAPQVALPVTGAPDQQ